LLNCALRARLPASRYPGMLLLLPLENGKGALDVYRMTARIGRGREVA
jgi:hypothetical protein